MALVLLFFKSFSYPRFGLIKEFNKYLQFDKYQITRTNTEINLTPITKINLDEQFQSDNENIENNFIKH